MKCKIFQVKLYGMKVQYNSDYLNLNNPDPGLTGQVFLKKIYITVKTQFFSCASASKSNTEWQYINVRMKY